MALLLAALPAQAQAIEQAQEQVRPAGASRALAQVGTSQAPTLPTGSGSTSTVSTTGAAEDAAADSFDERLRGQSDRLERQQRQIEELRDELDAGTARAEAQRKDDGAGLRRLQWSGYGIVNYQRYDFYPNAQSRTAERRARTDLERLILAPRFNFGRGFSFHAEVEFEHGGTGTTVEYEREEAGEFEAEIEKGGEVAIEFAYLQYESGGWFNARIGELVVPFGMVNTHHQPSEYFTIERSLAETSLIPSVWHESGLEMYGSVGRTRYQVQLVTALDSTGFSGYGFVSGGTQSKFEFRNARSLALIARVDRSLAPGVLLGGGYYLGNSSRNRPRQNLSVDADVSLAELHARYERGPFTLRTQAMWGRLQNSSAVTRANLATFNGGLLGTSRTPVGSRARAFFVEAGYDVLSFIDGANASLGRLDAFARIETWDTHAGTEGTIVRVARYDRKAITAGLNYKPQPGIVFKAEYSRRTHSGAVANTENYLGLGVGFEF